MDPLTIAAVTFLGIISAALGLAYQLRRERRLRAELEDTRRLLTNINRQRSEMIDLLALLALQKGGTLRIPCARPNWSAPGVNIGRKGNVYYVTVQGGPHH